MYITSLSNLHKIIMLSTHTDTLLQTSMPSTHTKTGIFKQQEDSL